MMERGIGDNRPDAAVQVADQLRHDYDDLAREVLAALRNAKDAPVDIQSDEDMGALAKIIKNLRDLSKRIATAHDTEKQPHLRAGQAVDQFFFTMLDKCVRRNRMNKPGAADILQLRLDDYNQRKLAAERERRRQEAEDAARVERARREAEEKTRREAEEARLAAERARKPKTIEAKEAIAAQAETDAAVAKAQASIAAVRAEDARIATLAKPADIIRTRIDEGPLVTMGTEPYAIIEDEKIFDQYATLWAPFVTRTAKEQALRAYAKTRNYNEGIPGARVGRKPKSVVR